MSVPELIVSTFVQCKILSILHILVQLLIYFLTQLFGYFKCIVHKQDVQGAYYYWGQFIVSCLSKFLIHRAMMISLWLKKCLLILTPVSSCICKYQEILTLSTLDSIPTDLYVNVCSYWLLMSIELYYFMYYSVIILSSAASIYLYN